MAERKSEVDTVVLSWLSMARSEYTEYEFFPR